MAEHTMRGPGRRTPAKGVHIFSGRPSWVFLTVTIYDHGTWLAQSSAQMALHEIWEKKATAWMVSDYLLMPDHLHLFCAPSDLRFSIERWMGYWKDCFAKKGLELGRFQDGGFHHRLRDDENYAEKWQYVQQNPVRAGLVSTPEEWPYKGFVHPIRFQE